MAAESGRSGETAGYPVKIEIADSDEEVQAAFDVMKHLRDLLEAFSERVTKQWTSNQYTEGHVIVVQCILK